MKVKDLLTAFTKYYIIYFANDGIQFEDQTIVPERYMGQMVLHCDFEPDDGNGEQVTIYSYDTV